MTDTSVPTRNARSICMISFGNLIDPRNGYALRCWMLAQRLVKEGNEVTVYQFAQEDGTQVKDGITVHSIGVRHEQTQKTWLEKTISFDPTKEVIFQIEGYNALRKRKAELSNFDQYYIELCLLMNAVAFVKGLGKPITLDTHCIHKDVALKLRDQHKVVGTIRVAIWHVLEKAVLRNVGNIIAISDNDKRFIVRHYGIPAERIDIIAHEVLPPNSEKFSSIAKDLRKQLAQKRYDRIACFIGDLGAIQNIETEKYIRTVLAPATPNVRYVIVGNNPNNHKDAGNIIYTGFVESLDPYIMMADFCIAPMSVGSGIKTKVLDYLKYDQHVIATPIAIEGIEPSAKTKVCELETFVDTVQSFTGSPA